MGGNGLKDASPCVPWPIKCRTQRRKTKILHLVKYYPRSPRRCAFCISDRIELNDMSWHNCAWITLALIQYCRYLTC